MAMSRMLSEIDRKRRVDLNTWREECKLKQQCEYDVHGRNRKDRGFDAVPEEYLGLKVGGELFGIEKNFDEYDDDEMSKVRIVVDQIKEFARPERNGSIPYRRLAIIHVHVLLESNVPIKVPVFRVIESNKGTDFFIDVIGRTYKNVTDFKENNKFPAGLMCFPKGGFYQAGSDHEVELEFLDTPACNSGLEVADALGTMLSICSFAAGAAFFMTPIGVPVLAIAGPAFAGATGFKTMRTAGKLIDKFSHNESLTSLESIGLWADLILSSTAFVFTASAVLKGALATDSILLASECAGVPAAQLILRQMSLSAGLRVASSIIRTVLDRVENNNWTDLRCFRNWLRQTFNMFFTEEEVAAVLRTTKQLKMYLAKTIKCAGEYLQLSKEKLISVSRSVLNEGKDLLRVITISGKFFIRIALVDYQAINRNFWNAFDDLANGRIDLKTFYDLTVGNFNEIFELFREPLEEAKQQFRLLHGERTIEDVFGRSLSNEQLRQYWVELNNIILGCGLAKGGDTAAQNYIAEVPLQLLSGVITRFHSALDGNADASCSVNEYFRRTRFVCSTIKEKYLNMINQYKTKYNRIRELDPENFNSENYNRRQNIADGVTIEIHFFKKAINDEQAFLEMVEDYRTIFADEPAGGTASFQTNNVKHFTIHEPSHDLRYESFFKNLTILKEIQKVTDKLSKKELVLEMEEQFQSLKNLIVFDINNNVSDEDLRKRFHELSRLIPDNNVTPLRMLGSLMARFLSEFRKCNLDELLRKVEYLLSCVNDHFTEKFNEYKKEVECSNKKKAFEKFEIVEGIEAETFFLKRAVEYIRSETEFYNKVNHYYRLYLREERIPRQSMSELIGDVQLWRIFGEVTGQTNINAQNASLRRRNNLIFIETHTYNNYMDSASFYLHKAPEANTGGVSGLLSVYKH